MLKPKNIHPTGRTLVAYLDGEVSAEKRREIARHLLECPDCRAERDTIEADLDWHLVLDAALLPSYEVPSAEGLRRVLAMARQWRQAHPELAGVEAEECGAENGRRMEHQFGEALELLFGTAAGAVTREGGKAGNTEEAEPLLSAFLGKRVTSTMMSRLRRRERMGRYLAADLM